MNEILKGFPYSKEEYENIVATVEILIIDVIRRAAKLYPSYIGQIQKGYHTLKYPLIAVWEYYGFGNKSDVMGLSSPMYYEAFKYDAEDMLEEYIKNLPKDNPFNCYGEIPNSSKVVEKVVIVYKHLLENIRQGRIMFPRLDH